SCKDLFFQQERTEKTEEAEQYGSMANTFGRVTRDNKESSACLGRGRAGGGVAVRGLGARAVARQAGHVRRRGSRLERPCHQGVSQRRLPRADAARNTRRPGGDD